MYTYLQTINGDNKPYHKSKEDEYTNSNEVLIFQNTDDYTKIAFMKVSQTKYTIIDFEFIDNIVPFSWHLGNHGYIVHTLTKTTAKDISSHTAKSIYLHQFIMKYFKEEECPEKCTSVDHINHYKLDNRMCNLRWANQSLQITNRTARSDQKPPPNELQEMNILAYPRHIRYDNSQQRYILEKHPELINKGMVRINGTRTGTIYEKYYDILKKGQTLDNECYNTTETSETNTKYKQICEVIDSFNEYMNQPILCQPMLIPSSYKEHLEILCMSNKINTESSSSNNDTYHLPKFCYFSQAKPGRGCCFKIDKSHPNYEQAPKKQSSSSISLSTKEKYDEFMQMLNALENDLPIPEMKQVRAPKKEKHPEEVKTAAKQDIEDGLCKKEVLEKHNISEAIFYKWKDGEKKKPVTEHTVETKEQVLHDVLVNKMKMSEASKKYDISATTIQTWRNAKEKQSGEVTIKITRTKISDEVKSQVLEDIANGMTQADAAKKHGIKSSSIGNWINKK